MKSTQLQLAVIHGDRQPKLLTITAGSVEINRKCSESQVRCCYYIVLMYAQKDIVLVSVSS